MRTSTSTHLQLGKLPEGTDERKNCYPSRKILGKNLMAGAQNAQPELKNYLSKGCDAIRHSMPKLLRQYPLSALTQN